FANLLFVVVHIRDGGVCPTRCECGWKKWVDDTNFLTGETGNGYNQRHVKTFDLALIGAGDLAGLVLEQTPPFPRTALIRLPDEHERAFERLGAAFLGQPLAPIPPISKFSNVEIFEGNVRFLSHNRLDVAGTEIAFEKAILMTGAINRGLSGSK